MRKYERITPEGTKDLLFEECAAQKWAMNQIREVFEAGEYHEVITPGIEFYDVFSSNSLYFPQESMYKLTDHKGRLMAMRPDSTIPIARLTATKLKGHPLPLRLYYAQSIYRQQPEFKGRNSEIMQMGIELIGLSTFASDMEVLTTGIESLSASCGEDFRLELGHIGIFKSLMERLEATKEQKERIHGLILSKNYAALSDVLESFSSSPTVEMLKELPKLFGGQEALEKARSLAATCDGKLMVMLDYLEKIFQALKEIEVPGNGKLGEKVMIDFGLVQQAEYYSSLIFRGYSSSAGEPVLSGGRYDELFKDFGESLPAIGFGINIDQLAAKRLKEKDQVGKKNGVKKEAAEAKIRIALTKGRLEKSIVGLFKELGYDCSQLEEKGRKLLIPIPNRQIEVVLAKSADVITYVEHGVCDVGIVGKDTILESGGTFYEVLDLGFGKCRFALAVPKGSDFYSGYSTKRIATKYPKVARTYFESKGMDVEVIKIEGSVELAPLLSLADGIVDIVETGTTLKENGLEVIEEIRNVSARFIVNEASMKMKKAEIEELIGDIQQKVKG